MPIEWDKSEQPSITWDEEQPQQPERDRSLVGQAKKFGMDVSGAAMAGIDMVASLPGLVGAGAAALTHGTGIGDEEVNTGRKPTEVVSEVMQSANEGNPLNYLPEKYTALRNTEGYDVANKWAGKAFSMVGQGWGNIAAQGADASGHKEMAEKLGDLTDAVVQGGLLTGGMFEGGKAVKPGDLAFRKATEPITPKEAAPSDSGGALEYIPQQSRQIQKTGMRDNSLTIPDMPSIEPDKTAAYTWKNKKVLDDTDSYDLRKGSSIAGIDFTTISLENPEHVDNLKNQLSALRIKDVSDDQARALISQMQDKAIKADEEAKPMAHTISRRIPPLAVLADNVIEGYKRINASPMNAHVELVDTRLMELMRDHDRLTAPKSLNQFLEKENSVLNEGVHKGLTLSYWPEEGRIVQTNGNTRRGVAAKHGMMEIPAYVRVMKGKVPEEWQKSAVSLPGLKWEGEFSDGQFAKPSEVGLPSRSLNEGVFNPQIKYAPDPTLSKDTVRVPAGHFQNNHLFDAQHNSMPMNGARQGVQIVADRSASPWYRQLAKILLKDETFNPNFQVREKTDPGYKYNVPGKADTLGQYRPRDYEASVRRDMTGNEYIFMHEMMHAYVHSVIQKLIDGKLDRMHPSYDSAKRMVELWQNLSIDSEVRRGDELENKVNANKTEFSPLAQVAKKYGITDPHEFVSEAFSNPEFQNLLKQISLPDHLQPKRGFSYYWDAFIEHLSNLIGIKRGDNNYLAATLEAGSELMRTSNKNDRMFYTLEQNGDTWHPRAIGMEGRTNFMEDVITNKKLAEADRRPLQQVISEARYTSENFKDLDNGTKGNLFQMLWGGAKLFGRQLVENRTVALLNKRFPGAGELLKNIADRTFTYDRWVKSQIEETMTGKELKAMKFDYRGFVHRLGSRDGIDVVLKELGDKEATEMFKTWLPNTGKKDLFRSDFANDRQWKTHNIIINQTDRVLGIINGLRQQLNKPVIERLKGFFPASREPGDYRVTIKDRDPQGKPGQVRDLTTFKRSSPLKALDSLYDAQKHVKTMRKLFPYAEVSDPFHVDKNQLRDLNGNVLTELERILKSKETDYDVWAEGERINNQDHELTRLIQKAKADHFTKQGMGGHLISRKINQAIGGYLGSDFNPRDAREGLQQYFEYAYTYAGNLQKTLLEKELNELTIPHPDGEKPLSQIAPNLDTYLHQVIDTSKGKHNQMDMSEQIFLGELTKRMGEGASSPTRGVAGMSRFAMVWYLFKPAFFGTQPLQVFNSYAHLVEMHGFSKGAGYWLEGLQNSFFPGANEKAAVRWAVENGYIDPITHKLLDDYNSNIPTRVFLRTTGGIEREAVRIPAFLQFEAALKDTVSDPVERYKQASEKMAYSMSMTNRSNQPLIWDKLGIIGQGMRSLKSYSTNIWGQFAYFVNEAAEAQKYKPLAAFMGTEALIGGVKGVVLVNEINGLVALINWQTNSNLPNTQELLLKMGAPDWFVYGLASVAIGKDISNQVGNPAGVSYIDFIPAKLAIDVVEQNKKYIVAAVQGQLTDDIRMQTWLANTPSIAHEMVRNLFTKPGQPTPTPGMNMQGAYYRDAQEKAISSTSGIKSVKEARADDLQRFFRQYEQRLVANKAQLQNAMVDDMLNGKGIDPSKIQEYVTQGGDVNNLSTDLKNTIIERHRSAIFNQIVNKSRSPSQAQKLRDVQPYLQNQPSNIYPEANSSNKIQWDDAK